MDPLEQPLALDTPPASPTGVTEGIVSLLPLRESGGGQEVYLHKGTPPWVLFGGIFLIASIGGLGALLRNGQPITKRQLFSALINSGMVGVIIALVMWEKFGSSEPYWLVGISALAGLGGATTLDILLQYVRKKLGIGPSSKANSQNNVEDS